MPWSINCLAVGEDIFPESEEEILVTLPKNLSQNISEYRQASDSRSPSEIAELVQYYLALASESGDERYLGYADAAINNVQDSASPDFLLAKAALLQRRHQFSNALLLLNGVLKKNPSDSRAHLMAAYIYLAEGNASLALEHCGQTAQLYGTVTALSCTASAAALQGELDKHFQALKLLQDQPGLNQLERRELRLTLAEIASMRGDFDQAASYFEGALADNASDSFLLMRLADLYLGQQRYADCINLLRDHQQHPSLFLRFAIARLHRNGELEHEHASKLQRYFELQALRNPGLATRDYGEFLLEIKQEPQQALDVALENWGKQREVADTELVVRAAIAADNLSALDPVRTWLGETGLRDHRIQIQLAELGD